MNFFRRFFNKYFVIGIIIILLSIIINLSFEDSFIQMTIVNLLNTIGVALLIGAIFDFSRNSNDFMTFVSSILKEIIISRNFLKDLDDKEKKKALEMILTPSGNQLEQCSDIQMYFEKKLDDTMEIFHTNFKTNLVINAEAKKRDGIVQVDATMVYRVYKIEDKYFPIKTSFAREGCTVEKSYILYPEGTKEIKDESSSGDGEKGTSNESNLYVYEIPDELYKYSYLTIKKEVTERGFDHWTNFHWSTLTPSDGITFNLKCSDGLHIKEYFIFDAEELYSVSESEDKTNIDIISTQWLDKNSGFVFTISDTKS